MSAPEWIIRLSITGFLVGLLLVIAVVACFLWGRYIEHWHLAEAERRQERQRAREESRPPVLGLTREESLHGPLRMGPEFTEWDFDER